MGSGISSFILGSAVLFVSACGQIAPSQPSTPSEQDGRAAVAASLGSKFRGENYALKSFEKTNGWVQEGSDGNGYVMEYKAAVNFPNGHLTQCLGPGPVPMICSYDVGMSPVPPQRPGEDGTLTGKLTFRKTENGWTLAS